MREQLPLPTKPPYTAHLGNLSFDATEGDITDFFADCQVTNVRIVEDKLERKPKGFGYVEFGTLEGLKKALDLSGTQFQGRNVRVSVAEPRKSRARCHMTRALIGSQPRIVLKQRICPTGLERVLYPIFPASAVCPTEEDTATMIKPPMSEASEENGGAHHLLLAMARSGISATGNAKALFRQFHRPGP